MSKNKLPTTKIERASRFLKTGLKVGSNYVKHYGKKILNEEVDDKELEHQNAEDIFEAFSELRGSALKMAQMLSLDTVSISSEFTNVMQKAQYSVPPMSAPMAVQAFKNSMGKNPEQVFDRFNPNAIKAASMGQVHEAELNGKKLAIKIQYPGVSDSIKSDIKLVKSVAPRIVNTTSAELVPYFEEVEARLLEESDYTIELKNSLDFKENCKDIEGVVFPNYYPEYSSNRVICMDWLDGWHQKEFLAKNPSIEIRTKAADSLWNFYEYQIHKLRRVNADPHPGNFLFRMDGTIGVLDFGCTKVLDDELHKNYFTLANPNLFTDEKDATDILLKLQILRPTDKGEKLRYLYTLFRRLISLIAKPYHDGKFNFNNPAFYDEMTEISLAISKLRELRGSKDFLFINRTYFGLYSLFRQLDVEINTTCKYFDFLRKE